MNLQNLKDLHAKATQGEWEVVHDLNNYSWRIEHVATHGVLASVGDMDDTFAIVALRNAFPQIVKELEAGQRLHDALVDAIHKMVDTRYLNPDDEDDRNPLWWLHRIADDYKEQLNGEV